MEDSFPMDRDRGWEEVVSGRFEHITFIEPLTSIIITSAPPQIIIQIHEVHLESSSITAASWLCPFLSAMRVENIVCLLLGLCVSQEGTLPWLLHQPGERLCCVRLFYGCCYSCYVSQERINVSAVLMTPQVFFQSLSLGFAYHGFKEQCT